MKRPAYQWYPKDAKADEVFQLMTYEQQGIYRALLDHQWEEGSIPADVDRLAGLFPKITNTRFRKLWPLISAKFQPHGTDRLVNAKLGCQRKQLEQFIEEQREKGRKGGQKKAERLAAATLRLEPERSSSSSSATATTVKTQEPPYPPFAQNSPLIARGAHKAHAYCGKVCLPAALLETFRQRMSHLPEHEAADYVSRFFDDWNTRYTSGDRANLVVGEDAFDFWRERWKESHPSAPAITPQRGIGAMLSATSGFLGKPDAH